MRPHLLRPAGALLTCALSFGAARADTPPPPQLTLELNALEQVESACRISLVAENTHPFDIQQAVFEAVLFDTAGRVALLTLLDLGALPSARPRVRQFALPDLECATLGRVLINGAQTCTGADIPPTACNEGLKLRSRTDVEMIG